MNLRSLLKGPEGWKLDGCTNAPDFIFRDCCNNHDFAYKDKLGTREQADRAFYECMKIKANQQPWWSRWFWHSMARTYYTAVRAFGKPYWDS